MQLTLKAKTPCEIRTDLNKPWQAHVFATDQPLPPPLSSGGGKWLFKLPDYYLRTEAANLVEYAVAMPKPSKPATPTAAPAPSKPRSRSRKKRSP